MRPLAWLWLHVAAHAARTYKPGHCDPAYDTACCKKGYYYFCRSSYCQVCTECSGAVRRRRTAPHHGGLTSVCTPCSGGSTPISDSDDCKVEAACPAGHSGGSCAPCAGSVRRRRADICTACGIGYEALADVDECVKTCREGYYREGLECRGCVNGYTRRRRASSCTACPDHDPACTTTTTRTSGKMNTSQRLIGGRVPANRVWKVQWSGSASAPSEDIQFPLSHRLDMALGDYYTLSKAFGRRYQLNQYDVSGKLKRGPLAGQVKANSEAIFLIAFPLSTVITKQAYGFGDSATFRNLILSPSSTFLEIPGVFAPGPAEIATIPTASGASAQSGSTIMITVGVVVGSGLVTLMVVGLACVLLYQKTRKPSTADMGSGDVEACADDDTAIVKPDWWDEWPSSGKALRSVAKPDVRSAVQTLFDQTTSDKVTRDRKGDQCSHGFEVVNVLRNENRDLWEKYIRAQRRIRRATIHPVQAATMIEGAALGPLDSTVNELFLFHGTTPTAADRICTGDFKLDLAGSHKGTLYGPGVYFAEKSTKSDEYASDDRDGIYQGLYAMLLCRVTCGNLLYCDDVRPDAARLVEQCGGSGAHYNGVLGDREKCRGTYREFVVYDVDQAYPEFVVIYRRKGIP